MSFFSLISTVIVGVLFFIIYFGLSNFILDLVCKFKSNSVALENSVRAIIFIAPAFLVLFMFILYPVFETVRLSFYDKFGLEFVGWNYRKVYYFYAYGHIICRSWSNMEIYLRL